MQMIQDTDFIDHSRDSEADEGTYESTRKYTSLMLQHIQGCV
jgi:hypothetical protein